MQQKREIGRSGIKITPLVLGGNVFGWTADEAASFAILDAFVDQGGDAIDTADVYSAWVPGHEGGESERVIGAWLKKSGKRDKVVIGTKVGMWPKRLGIKRQNIVEACEDSLKRLGIATIDLYWLHRDDEATDAEEYTAGLEDLIKAGKIRSFGASNFKPGRFGEGIAAAKARDLHFDAQQPEYNLMNREIEAELLGQCEREGVSILPYYGLASGYLTGKYRSAEDKSKSARGGRMDKYMEGKGPAVLAALDEISACHKATQAQVALAWIMAKLPTGAPIASATSVTQLDELMGALRVTLGADDLAALDRASA
ncbi:aldo/keto reductase [Candidatus Viadribacter manganicus]|uniref:Alcohol dehydrogenase n=1 Tax=Candidatus Viadribacter manganicus TaxID=1759059 RepID=A0A1B1AIU3_9PROT|nr:aldo/keto reductase [Candidatus Viadribacter manganicus]ANP46489.1 alcohol dehydrogenase [Candidatus Viadribacter manganicus]